MVVMRDTTPSVTEVLSPPVGKPTTVTGSSIAIDCVQRTGWRPCQKVVSLTVRRARSQSGPTNSTLASYFFGSVFFCTCTSLACSTACALVRMVGTWSMTPTLASPSSPAPPVFILSSQPSGTLYTNPVAVLWNCLRWVHGWPWRGGPCVQWSLRMEVWVCASPSSASQSDRWDEALLRRWCRENTCKLDAIRPSPNSLLVS
mmetsp:Transcript_6498/g.15718  ORF Transcript_6498/g.15718 Transcript_6498/m.15718 type:complete len:202 (+) Transcript_6498:1492-2097(+)